MKFKKVYIEITNICNLSCSFCSKLERKAEFMKIEDFKKIATEVKEFTDYIYLHVKGEPVLHPNIEEFIEYSASLGLKVNITTNGTILKESLLNFLASNNPKIPLPLPISKSSPFIFLYFSKFLQIKLNKKCVSLL